MENRKLRSMFKPVNNLLFKSYLPGIINCAVEIGLFEALSGGGLSADALSERLDTVKDIIQPLVEVLISIELVFQKNGLYFLTRVSEDFLIKSSQANQISEIKCFSEPAGPFENLTEILKNGPPEYDGGMFNSKEAIMKIEQRTKGGQLQDVVGFITSIPGFMSARTMCDFAGSSGYYSLGLLRENPELRARVFDRPEVVTIAKELNRNSEFAGRMEYTGIDIEAGDSFGNSYDLFFVSHYLYHWGALNILADFFKRVNKAMNPGGIFVSNHTCSEVYADDHITQAIVELWARITGYPTLDLPESTLKASLSEAGFGNFTVKPAYEGSYSNTMLLSARKIKEI
ncbi:MAG: hypothetical protein GY737_16325 [Desulfobacteraceae bacterium]|nr:hypothetical protein [Desulfobacteraceae bacterium]